MCCHWWTPTGGRSNRNNASPPHMISPKIDKPEVWWHPRMMQSATISTTVGLSRGVGHTEVFSFTRLRPLTPIVSHNGPFFFSAGRMGRMCFFRPSSEKTRSRAFYIDTHVRCKRGRGKPFLEIQGACRDSWAGVKNPSVCVPVSCISPSSCVEVIYSAVTTAWKGRTLKFSWLFVVVMSNLIFKTFSDLRDAIRAALDC